MKIWFLVLMICSVFADGSDGSTGSTEGIAVAPGSDLFHGVQKESFAFETEVNRLMKIIINSLYKSKEVFLRELISNASDALDKIRFLGLTSSSELETNSELKITILADQEAKTLTISDSGVGMTRSALKEHLGVIAKSGTADFIKQFEKNNSDSSLIGQFGVGFYSYSQSSAFLVADKVTVVSKNNADEQYVWESNAENEFALFKDPRGNTLKRGTSIILHLKEDALDFLDDAKLKSLVKRYSEFINFPIYLWSSKTIQEEVEEESFESDSDEETAQESDVESVEDVVEKKKKTVSKTVTDWELINDSKPIWSRPPAEVTEEEHHSFYKSFFNEYKAPTLYNHFKGEGEADFKAILYFPSTVSKDFLQDGQKWVKGVKLFVKRVFITDQLSDLLPRWLRFLKAVVDADDLNLNVSRETLQTNSALKLIKKKLIGKALDSIAKLSENVETYKTFWKEYATILKQGLATDTSSKKKLTKLMRYPSSVNDFTSLEEYVDRMKDKQPQIYYLTARSVEEAKSSPLAESLIARGYEVLYMADLIDEYLVGQVLNKFDSYPLQHIGKQGLKFGDEEEKKEAGEAHKIKFEPLTKWLMESLTEMVSEVKVSSQLTKSPCAVLASPYGHSAAQERLAILQSEQSDPRLVSMRKSKRVLEINPEHPVIIGLLDRVVNGKLDGLENIPYILLESTAIAAGWDPREPTTFASKVDGLLRHFVGIDMTAEAQVNVELAKDKSESTKKAEADKEETVDDEFPDGLSDAFARDLHEHDVEDL